MSYRIMIQGEDGTIWCEKNGLTKTWAENNALSSLQQIRNATWWIENEDPFANVGSQYYDRY